MYILLFTLCNIDLGDNMKFEIKKVEYVNKTFRISKDLTDRLSYIAQSQGVSVNELVVQCCEYALNNMETEEEK